MLWLLLYKGTKLTDCELSDIHLLFIELFYKSNITSAIVLLDSCEYLQLIHNNPGIRYCIAFVCVN